MLGCVEAPYCCGHCREAYNLDGVFVSFRPVSLLRVHMYRDAELLNMPQLKHTLLFRCVSIPFSISIQPNQLVQEVQQDYKGYVAHLPVAGPPEVYPGVWPHTAPLVDFPPAANGLKTCWSFPEQSWHARQHASD